MQSLYFDEIITKGVRAGQIPARTQSARNWYRETAEKITRIRNQDKMINSDPKRATKQPIPGSMYLFNYNPKFKDELPYYDRYPLIFPYQKTENGFYGLNLHYLPLQLRAKMMDALYSLVNNPRYDETTKIKACYSILKGAEKYRFFQPCIKRYLNSQVKSQFMYVYPSEWDIALFLPTESFAKKTKTQVWAESKKMLGVRK
jgi:hypothetical protein